MVFNATFNNISGISWQSVLLEKKQEYPGKTIDLSQVTVNWMNDQVSNTGSDEHLVFLQTS
jgi:hypothetical protein